MTNREVRHGQIWRRLSNGSCYRIEELKDDEMVRIVPLRGHGGRASVKYIPHLLIEFEYVGEQV